LQTRKEVLHISTAKVQSQEVEKPEKGEIARGDETSQATGVIES
jgi:hypothetical protein